MPFKSPEKRREYYLKNREKSIAQAKEYAEKNRDKIRPYQRENARNWARKNPNKIRESAKRFRKNNVEKGRAWDKADRKVKMHGLCQRCKKREAIDRHHQDYSKPLEVELLCRICHKQADKERREKENNQARQKHMGKKGYSMSDSSSVAKKKGYVGTPLSSQKHISAENNQSQGIFGRRDWIVISNGRSTGYVDEIQFEDSIQRLKAEVEKILNEFYADDLATLRIIKKRLGI